MDVKLLSHTPDALNLLLRTKNTRLNFDSDPSTWTEGQRRDHLEYMTNTIKSSWEFVDYVFEISGVTRAFTHQLVRTRTGSYAQEAQRVVDLTQRAVVPPDIEMSEEEMAIWNAATAASLDGYRQLRDMHIPLQTARGILPTNMSTSIMAKFNLRSLHEMAKLRLCTRTQGEYQRVFRAMRAAVIAVHPWVEEFNFIEVHCASTGTCAFPRYGAKECPFFDKAMDLDRVKQITKNRFWAADEIVQASPTAVNGKAM